ncbi:hypothetical protein M1N70_01180 [Peptococcaceae bacterium]|nr:hypothetical protein [Peptococcaceae bacterium]
MDEKQSEREVNKKDNKVLNADLQNIDAGKTKNEADTSLGRGQSIHSSEMQTVQALIAGIFPNAKYFDARFDKMQSQIDALKQNQDVRFEQMQVQIDGLRRSQDIMREDMDRRFEQVDRRIDELKENMDRRFEQVDGRFEQVDRRFEQVDKRFEQVDQRLEQIIASINKLSDKLENRERDQRNFTNVILL